MWLCQAQLKSAVVFCIVGLCQGSCPLPAHWVTFYRHLMSSHGCDTIAGMVNEVLKWECCCCECPHVPASDCKYSDVQ
jgi:hypothetical protein